MWTGGLVLIAMMAPALLAMLYEREKGTIRERRRKDIAL